MRILSSASLAMAALSPLQDVARRGEIALTPGVVLVAQEMANPAGGGSSQNRPGGLPPGQRGFEVRDILLPRRHILPGDRAVTRRSGNGGLASHTLTRCGLRKILPIGAHGHSALPPKPGQAVFDIGRVANLPLLT